MSWHSFCSDPVVFCDACAKKQAFVAGYDYLRDMAEAGFVQVQFNEEMLNATEPITRHFCRFCAGKLGLGGN